MSEANLFATLQQITGSFILSRCLHVIAELGVADALDETPRTAAELAPLVSANPDALGRVMSLLSAYGVFEAHEDKFRHSPASRLLQNDHPYSMRAFVRTFGRNSNWASYQVLEHTLRTGLPARNEIIPEGQWAYLAEHPEESDTFNAAMAAKARLQVAAVMAAYDFSGFALVADIGGGLGHLLNAILDAVPTAKGVLFDLPHVINQVKGLSSERVTLLAGDFFKDSLPSCDAYLLMEVIHDWDDEPAVSILKAVRRAAPSHAKLLLLELIIPDRPGPDWSKLLDIHMMTLLGGRQRTLQEYAALFEKSGFSFGREINTGAGISILEANPV